MANDEVGPSSVVIRRQEVVMWKGTAAVQSALAHAIGPRSNDCCGNCPPDRVCAWDCEQGMGVLEILLGQALAERARRAPPIVMPDPELAPISAALWECYN